jgi:hypothetical protein
MTFHDEFLYKTNIKEEAFFCIDIMAYSNYLASQVLGEPFITGYLDIHSCEDCYDLASIFIISPPIDKDTLRKLFEDGPYDMEDLPPDWE